MEERQGGILDDLRKPFQGVWNIIRFNWQHYVVAFFFIILAFLLNFFISQPYQFITLLAFILIVGVVFLSLGVSFYIYDLSGLYKLNWLDLEIGNDEILININAGFDETSALITRKFPKAKLIVYDFYDPEKHTEWSIKRARKAYPPFRETVKIDTSNIPLPGDCIDKSLLIFAAHEIRNSMERKHFFTEIERTLKPNGKVIILEHLRDWPNFLAYNIGFLHFMSRSSWKETFQDLSLTLINEKKVNPFVTCFILEKNGNTS